MTIYKPNRDDDIQHNNINIRNPLPTSAWEWGLHMFILLCCMSSSLFGLYIVIPIPCFYGFWHSASLHLHTFYGNVFYTCITCIIFDLLNISWYIYGTYMYMIFIIIHYFL